jgi:hypothetical protein
LIVASGTYGLKQNSGFKKPGRVNDCGKLLGLHDVQADGLEDCIGICLRTWGSLDPALNGLEDGHLGHVECVPREDVADGGGWHPHKGLLPKETLISIQGRYMYVPSKKNHPMFKPVNPLT